MNKQHKHSRIGTGFGGLFVALALIVSAPTVAFADADETADVEVPDVQREVRVVDRSSEINMAIKKLQDEALISASVTEAVSVPEEFQPEVGETVQVVYSNGVETHYGVSLACTTSSTTGNPVKVSNSVRASLRHSRSSGCSAATITAFLQYQGWLGAWLTVHTDPALVNPGTAVNWYTGRPCQNSISTNWRSGLDHGGSTLGLSGTSTLACGA